MDKAVWIRGGGVNGTAMLDYAGRWNEGMPSAVSSQHQPQSYVYTVFATGQFTEDKNRE